MERRSIQPAEYYKEPLCETTSNWDEPDNRKELNEMMTREMKRNVHLEVVTCNGTNPEMEK